MVFTIILCFYPSHPPAPSLTPSSSFLYHCPSLTHSLPHLPSSTTVPPSLTHSLPHLPSSTTVPPSLTHSLPHPPSFTTVPHLPSSTTVPPSLPHSLTHSLSFFDHCPSLPPLVSLFHAVSLILLEFSGSSCIDVLKQSLASSELANERVYVSPSTQQGQNDIQAWDNLTTLSFAP